MRELPEESGHDSEIDSSSNPLESGYLSSIRDGLRRELTQEESIDFLSLKQRLKDGISDIKQAKDVIDQLRNYVDPIIAVSDRTVTEIEQNGILEAHKSWIPGLKILVGNIATKPYEDTRGRSRTSFRILSNVPVEPRFTGPDKKFHGIIYTKKDKLTLHQDIEYLN